MSLLLPLPIGFPTPFGRPSRPGVTVGRVPTQPLQCLNTLHAVPSPLHQPTRSLVAGPLFQVTLPLRLRLPVSKGQLKLVSVLIFALLLAELMLSLGLVLWAFGDGEDVFLFHLVMFFLVVLWQLQPLLVPQGMSKAVVPMSAFVPLILRAAKEGVFTLLLALAALLTRPQLLLLRVGSLLLRPFPFAHVVLSTWTTGVHHA